jgi:hypothetical protein
MRQFWLADQLQSEADMFCELCCNILGVDPKGVDPYARLLLWSVAREAVALPPGSGFAGVQKDFVASISSLPRGLVMGRARPATSGRLDVSCSEMLGTKHGVPILVLLYRLSQGGGVYSYSRIEEVLVPCIQKLVSPSSLIDGRAGRVRGGGLEEVNAEISLICPGPRDFRECAIWLSRAEVSEQLEAFDGLASQLDCLAADELIKSALVTVLQCICEGALAPQVDEDDARWVERAHNVFELALLGQPGFSKYKVRNASAKKRRQGAEFKSLPLKKLATDEARARLVAAWDRGERLLDKAEFENQLAIDCRGLSNDLIDDAAFDRLITVSASLAYLALGLYKKDGGWFVDEKGRVLLDLGKALRLGGVKNSSSLGDSGKPRPSTRQ